MNDKIKIKTQSGEEVEAHAPIIISASRSTDIPAFYAKWFINRLRAGYCVWYNPFNQKPMYVSFNKCKVVVFWTKNPKPIIPYLNELDERGIHYYFQFSLNDYEKEGFEPDLPPLQKRIETFKERSQCIGKEKVIWRFDPMIITPKLTPCEILKRVETIGKQLKGYTDKLVFSFLDPYKKVKSNMDVPLDLAISYQKKLDNESNDAYNKRNPNKEPKEIKLLSDAENIAVVNYEQQLTEIAEGLMKIRERWQQEGWEISLGTCAEQIDLERYGIEHNRCIDGELMKRIFSDDTDLVYYLNYGKMPKIDLFYGQDGNDNPSLSPEKMKDTGQRKACGCMISKDIGMYDTCGHFCVYCYANKKSREDIENNIKQHNCNSESIINMNNRQKAKQKE